MVFRKKWHIIAYTACIFISSPEDRDEQGLYGLKEIIEMFVVTSSVWRTYMEKTV